MEFLYDYLDATFTLSGTNGNAADGVFVIRTVFAKTATADDVTGTMQQGDKLYKMSSESNFKWCNLSTCSETRDAVSSNIIQDTDIVNYPQPDEGNPNYVPFVVPVSPVLTVSEADLNGGLDWAVDFNMTNVVLFLDGETPVAISTLSSAIDVIHYFKLSYSPSSTGEDTDTDISVSLSYTKNEGNPPEDTSEE